MEFAISAGMVIGGLVLAFVGVTVFDVAVSVVGFAGGAMVGFTYGQYAFADAGGQASTLELALAVLAGGVVGVGLIWTLIRLVVMGPGFLAGAGITASVVRSGPLSNAEGVTLLAVLLGGVVGAAIAWALFRVVMAVVTAFVGATMVTLGGNVSRVVDAVRTLDPSVVSLELSSAVFLAVFVLGVISQLGQLVLGVADPERGGGSGRSGGATDG